MKGDFSRQTFDPRRHYAGVLMQQGRVQLDADWNEQESIQRRRTQLEAQDVIGRCGAPRDEAGFEVALAGNALTIGAGRFYVDGLLAESETDALAYEAQPDLLDPPSWLDALGAADTNLGLVYLDVWERHITPLDDRLLREVALGGPDTATRVKTVWQVRILPIAATGDPALLKKLQAQRAKLQQKLDDLTAAGGDTTEVEAAIAEVDAKFAGLERPARLRRPARRVGRARCRSGPPAECSQPAAGERRRTVRGAAQRGLSPAGEPALPGRGPPGRTSGERDVQVVTRQRHGRHLGREDQRQGRDRPRPRAGRRAGFRRRPVGRAHRRRAGARRHAGAAPPDRHDHGLAATGHLEGRPDAARRRAPTGSTPPGIPSSAAGTRRPTRPPLASR